MKHAELAALCERHRQLPALQQLQHILADTAGLSTTALADVYHAAVLELERQLWRNGFNHPLLADYQALGRMQQQLWSSQTEDQRHHFVLVIPVADRPQQLRDCLHSLLMLCQHFEYGDRDENDCYTHLTVLVADDSREPENVTRHRDLAEQMNAQGLTVMHFDGGRQLALLDRLDVQQAEHAQVVLGDLDRQHFYHKGASATRNLCYLKLQQLTKSLQRPLFYFIDSDQLFCVNTANNEPVYAVNYLYHLDRLFCRTQPLVVTGKVVGDPPVSPAVMAGNLLADINQLLHRLNACTPDQSCIFHRDEARVAEGAYHDMGELFGFKNETEALDYHCSLPGEHQCLAALQDFVGRLDGFFDGAHPTRATYFEYQSVDDSCKPARTVYTGNYLLHPQALQYFIPFAQLKLRMAGPSLGRIIQAELGERFVSVNLPMLHRRIQANTGQAEFRTGVARRRAAIDLSEEYERQYFGDLMLFTLVRMAQQQAMNFESESDCLAALSETEQQIAEQYQNRQQRLATGLQTLSRLFEQLRQRWKLDEQQPKLVEQMQDFIENIRANYGEDALLQSRLPGTEQHRQYLQRLVDALHEYPRQRRHWRALLQSM